MPAPISIADTLLLLRKVQEEAAPVELVGEGPGEQAIVMIGFVRGSGPVSLATAGVRSAGIFDAV